MFTVGDKYRTHPDSFVPGGTEVKIQYEGQEPLVYPRVKNPARYITAALDNHPEIINVWVLKGGEWEWVWTNEVSKS